MVADGAGSVTATVKARAAWPPDYRQAYAGRVRRLGALKAGGAKALACAKAHYAVHPAAFIEDWVQTYDPRNALSGGDMPASMPFIPFERQRDLITFLLGCLEGRADGLVEKCRDMGVTWIGCAFSVWLWLFVPGSAVGWGSRKEQLVDKLGDPDSIFEKIRMIIRGLPPHFLPHGFSPKAHLTFMKAINPETGATITGEAGDNIGRGGRKLIYFKDESAHYERPELIEAALSENTRVQIDISSVNGLGNVYHRKRESGVVWEPGQPILPGQTNVLVMDWRDHPAKSQAWYDQKRQKAVDQGLLHVFEQEVNRNYSASVVGTIIPAVWVQSAIDAHMRLGFPVSGPAIAGLDVADEGLDLNALAIRIGPVLTRCEAWGEGDTGQTTRRAVDGVADLAPVSMQYDAIGVGAGVKAEANRLKGERLLPGGIRFVPWHAGASVLNPDARVVEADRDSPMTGDFFANLKAQAWWSLRRRFELTHRAVTEGIAVNPDDLVSIPADLPQRRQLERELSQPTISKGAKMKLVVDKTPDGTRSPNMADAVVMAFFPADQGAYDASLGWV